MSLLLLDLSSADYGKTFSGLKFWKFWLINL
jgi:hypothetical protein